jgi:thioredoxin 1
VPVLVDFTAEWCAPCKQLAPIVDQLAEAWGERALVGRLDVDLNPQTTVRFGVLGIPALLLFKNGQLVARLNGLQRRDKIEAAFGQYL